MRGLPCDAIGRPSAGRPEPSLRSAIARAIVVGVSTETRAYRFVVEFMVEPEHPAYDDPEWAADAVWGALTNMYGLLSSCTSIEEIDPGQALRGS